jgi:beta-mannosidase
MKRTYDLSELEWTVAGWHPNWWRWGMAPDVAPVAAQVPGSVQQALREAGIVPDWNVGLDSRRCEWVENRDWRFEAELPAEWTRRAESAHAVLRCEGLDYQGVVLVNGRRAGGFRGSLTPHAFDLTRHLKREGNRLAIIFTENPRYLGQIGWTSKMRQWKPRFNYIWDWVARLVQVGVWDDLWLEVREGGYIESLSLYTDYDHRAGQGSVVIAAAIAGDEAQAVEVTIEGREGEVRRERFPMRAEFSARLDGLRLEPWQPNGHGEQRLYVVRVRLIESGDAVADEELRTVGFRHTAWRPCAGAPADAEPWICEINGAPTFLQGFNWSPIRPNFADVTQQDYRVRLQAYREMGCNLLRVWGGSFLEKECFYRLCDEMGLLVWQEFPLSSSGLENRPPDDAATMRELYAIAASHIRRRQHHPSLLMWSGGNELEGYKRAPRKPGYLEPVGPTYPTIAALAEVVRQLDPTRRFIPASPSGPRFSATPEEFGKGVHHEVHGPWNMAGPLENWFRFFDGDDALFRSETGFPGASAADLIRRYGGEMAWPGNADNRWWRHTGGWWIQWEDYLREGGDADDVEAYVRWSQARQAAALAYAARACKRRFPRCGGFMMWMGHDCWPCPVNNSVIDFLGRPKPAAQALAEVFHSAPGGNGGRA